MTVAELCDEATRRGLRLEPRGDKLAVIPARLCPPDFAATLRQRKGELLALLDGKTVRLRPDETPWTHVARQVLEGEFRGADRSTLESLQIGLQNIRHPDCQRATRLLLTLIRNFK